MVESVVNFHARMNETCIEGVSDRCDWKCHDEDGGIVKLCIESISYQEYSEAVCQVTISRNKVCSDCVTSIAPSQTRGYDDVRLSVV
jgi:hypothetical protein